MRALLTQIFKNPKYLFAETYLLQAWNVFHQQKWHFQKFTVSFHDKVVSCKKEFEWWRIKIKLKCLKSAGKFGLATSSFPIF